MKLTLELDDGKIYQLESTGLDEKKLVEDQPSVLDALTHALELFREDIKRSYGWGDY